MRSASARTARTTLTLALAVMAAVILGSVASQAAADDGPAPNLRFCLTDEWGRPNASQPVRLFTWDGSQAVLFRNGRTAADGCGTFRDVTANRYYFVDGYRATYESYRYSVGANVYGYVGSTPWLMVGNQQYATYQTPTGIIYGPFWLR